MQDNEQYLVRREKYQLLVPRIPRQSIDVFRRDVENGNYGLSAEKVDILASYLKLQQTLAGFGDLAFSADFINLLPSEFREKLGENLHPGIALSDLEIPTTDKLLLTQMLASDRLTDALSKTPVEVWVTPRIQEKLKTLGLSCETGLQQIDYGEQDVKTKTALVEIMEKQEHQVHTVLVARHQFPNGYQPSTIEALFSGEMERTTFNELIDLERQYKVAQRVQDNPFLVWFSENFPIDREKPKDAKKAEKRENTERIRLIDIFPIRVEEEAEGNWWMLEFTSDFERHDAAMKEIAEFLRRKYQNRNIYEILKAESHEEREEILAAFWRRGGTRQMYFGDESDLWEEPYELYLQPNGNLELHEAYGENVITIAPSPLDDDYKVAMVDQTVKWIKEEMERMEDVKRQWISSGLEQIPTVETSLTKALAIGNFQGLESLPKEWLKLIALGGGIELEEQIEQIPEWFQKVADQERQYYSSLLAQSSQVDYADLFTLLMVEDKPNQNMLKAYFDFTTLSLKRDKRLLVNPTELYSDLGLTASASESQVKAAYRKIAKETRAIHVNSRDEFDPEEWETLNDRFIKATKAYMAISNKKLGESRTTTLGRLSSYFQVTS
ncbi:MAG: hypothetical protein A2W22_00410 [Candidatus Levybacteria bacterium RBG_16_35_11]|nr:MAG: hypothetical protein A2W22_00410 [Candidatus Levybacteria bacterium RBG_16_35_11]